MAYREFDGKLDGEDDKGGKQDATFVPFDGKLDAPASGSSGFASLLDAVGNANLDYAQATSGEPTGPDLGVMDRAPSASENEPGSFASLPITPEHLGQLKANWNAATPDERKQLAKVPGYMGYVARALNFEQGTGEPEAQPDPLGIEQGPDTAMRQADALYSKTAVTDLVDPRAEARTRQMIRNGMGAELAAQMGRAYALRDVLPGQEPNSKMEATTFDFEARKRYNEDPFFKHPAVRAAVKGFEGFKQGVAGVNQFIAEKAGATGIADDMAKTGKDSRNLTDAMGEPTDPLQRNFEGAVSSIAQQLPALVGGAVSGSEPLVLGSMFVQSFGQEYSQGRASGQTENEATTRAGLFGAFEVIGEKFGLHNEMQMLRGAAHGVETDLLAKWMANTLKQEVPGEELTTLGEFLVDKLGGGIGLHQNASMEDYLGQVADTFTQTLMQGGLMSAGTSGLNHARRFSSDGSANVAALDANDARRDALNKWQTQGLSPSAAAAPAAASFNMDGTAAPAAPGRTEPTWADATGTPVPEPRREPTLGDITSATSVDDAIAAAQAMVSQPIAVPSQHATAADIDALEAAAGMGDAWQQASVATAPLATEAQMEAPQAPSDAAPVEQSDGWHTFPPETGTLGIPRAEMPQIKAEHRGAMVNFLNARGIAHDQLELPADQLKPTQAEFSIDKVQQAHDYQGGQRSILISSDGHVLDGHHQWLAAAETGQPVKAIRLQAPIRQLLDTVREFPSATVSEGAPARGPSSIEREQATPSSWIIRNKETGEVIAETYDRRKVDALNTAKYEAVPAMQHLQELNTPGSLANQVAHQPGGSALDQARVKHTRQDDEVRKAAENIERRKTTGGQRARDRLKVENPFLGFLASHGVHIEERSDTGGQGGRGGGMMVPGYGPLYRRSGKRLDELAQLAHEAGFLSQEDIDNPTDNGGTRKLADMIQSAVHGREVIRPAGMLEQAMPDGDARLMEEAQGLGISTEGKTADQVYDDVAAAHGTLEAQREQVGAGSVDEHAEIEQYADQFSQQDANAAAQLLRDADIPLEGGKSSDNLTDEEIDAIFGIRATGTTQEAGRQAQEGAGPLAQEGTEGTGEPGDLLAGYTREEVIARQNAEDTRAKQLEAERARLDAARKKEQDEKDIRARQDASAENFQLGQSADDALAGQNDLFSAPASAEQAASSHIVEVKEGPTAQRLRREDKHVFAQPRIHAYDPARARPVVLISCSDAKLEGGPHRAIDLYQGALFDVLRKWMPETNRPDVYIISAEHGLVHAEDMLSNYEQPMTQERLEALMRDGINARDIGYKNFSEVFIAGSAMYRELGQTYAERLRSAGFLGPEAQVLGSAPGAGIGTQRGDLGAYLRELEANGTPETQALADQLDADHESLKQFGAESKARADVASQAAWAAKQAKKAAKQAAKEDDAADIPLSFFRKVKVPHDVWIEDEARFERTDVPADQALASVREDIEYLESLLKCMKG